MAAAAPSSVPNDRSEPERYGLREFLGRPRAAVYESNDPIRVETTALVNRNMLTITFESSDARAQEDRVIALLKAADGHL